MQPGFGEQLRKDNRCTDCGGSLWFPFVWWRADNDIFVCDKCAAHMRKGFVADLIQCTAIKDMQAAGYSGFTLDRRSIKDAEQDAIREQETFDRRFFAKTPAK